MDVDVTMMMIVEIALTSWRAYDMHGVSLGGALHFRNITKTALNIKTSGIEAGRNVDTFLIISTFFDNF